MSWGHPWPGSGGETLRSTRLPAQFCHNAAASAVTSCSGSPGEGGSRPLPAAPSEFGTAQSPMGQFLSSTFEDSQGAIWHERLYEGEGKGAGEATLVLQDQVMYGEGGAWIAAGCEGAQHLEERVVLAGPWGSTTEGSVAACQGHFCLGAV